jgi:hypothetical protein
MKTRKLFAAAAVLLLAAPLARAQEMPANMQPGPEHEQMARDAGVWDAEMSMYGAPDAEAVTSKGVETNEMFGKIWLLSKFEGDVMGTPFSGRSQMTYDPVKKQYVGTWIDTMAPVMLTMSGTYDVATHTLTMMMEGTDAMTGQPGKWKSVTRYIDEDTKEFQMLAPVEGQDGQWWKMMEIKYKRRK